MSYEAQLQTSLTYWGPSTKDGFGGMSYDAPRTILGRWEDHNDAYMDAAGDEFRSSARIYSKEQLEQDGWIVRGINATSNPQNVEGAYKIRIIYTTQNPNASIIVYKCLMSKATSD